MGEERRIPGRLLVVDDNAQNLRLMQRRLEREGYEVELVDNGPDALERVGAGDIDLVLLDVMMPGMSGIDVVTRLRVHHRLHELPVIMVTALDQSSTAVEALTQGANDYVAKPVDYPVLFARVRTQLRVKRLGDLKDEFFRVASHDLRNPLTRVLAGADLVVSMTEPGEPLEPDAYRVLDGILRGAVEMERIIEDFLEFGAMDDQSFRLRPRNTDVGELIGRVAEAATDAARKKDITLRTECDRVQGRVDGDRLRQVITNLVSNALKFSPPGTCVVLRAAASAEALRVEVRDEGPGFAEEDLDHVFERYARLSAKPTAGEPSTGLGLSICRRIVELHGGTIGFANNDPGPGATLWFEIPTEGA